VASFDSQDEQEFISLTPLTSKVDAHRNRFS